MRMIPTLNTLRALLAASPVPPRCFLLLRYLCSCPFLFYALSLTFRPAPDTYASSSTRLGTVLDGHVESLKQCAASSAPPATLLSVLQSIFGCRSLSLRRPRSPNGSTKPFTYSTSPLARRLAYQTTASISSMHGARSTRTSPTLNTSRLQSVMPALHSPRIRCPMCKASRSAATVDRVQSSSI